jgi:5-oxoprolinase (ATP-hydrolysing) subunit A
MACIDLDADLGEGFGVWRLGDDDAMLGIVSSANVACGFHAGDPAGLLRVCRSAAERGVRIGAQVSYRDLAGFGRRFIDVAAEGLVADVVYQIGALQAIAHASGSAVSYVKPHGALYKHDRDPPRRAPSWPRRCTWWTPRCRCWAWRVRRFSTRRPASAYALCRRRSPITRTGRTASWFPVANRAQFARPGRDRREGGDHGDLG